MNNKMCVDEMNKKGCWETGTHSIHILLTALLSNLPLFVLQCLYLSDGNNNNKLCFKACWDIPMKGMQRIWAYFFFFPLPQARSEGREGIVST